MLILAVVSKFASPFEKELADLAVAVVATAKHDDWFALILAKRTHNKSFRIDEISRLGGEAMSLVLKGRADRLRDYALRQRQRLFPCLNRENYLKAIPYRNTAPKFCDLMCVKAHTVLSLRRKKRDPTFYASSSNTSRMIHFTSQCRIKISKWTTVLNV